MMNSGIWNVYYILLKKNSCCHTTWFIKKILHKRNVIELILMFLFFEKVSHSKKNNMLENLNINWVRIIDRSSSGLIDFP
jgi:hypothetical protein